ncbi:hypothetical protein AAG570_004482 [Ranatra chinensis]|uniref:Cytochrome P450 303a1 n=1 Tax=Ranatra chinensis TaxID=642074 RepID=A0ABD0YPJ9_9HEMI
MWLAVALFIFMLGLLLYLDTRKPRNYPPGPGWAPILGSAVTLARMRKEQGGYLFKATSEMAKKYGPVLGLRVGKDRLVVCHGYTDVKEMLSKEEFDGRPQGPFYETRTWGTRRGLLLTDEEFWQEQRRFVLRQLKEFGFGKRTMAELVELEATELVDMFKKKMSQGKDGEQPSAVIEMSGAFGLNVLNTLWMMMAGIRYSPDDVELKHVQDLLGELFASLDMVGALFSHFPVLRFVAPTLSGYKQFMDIHRKVWTFLKTELDKHKETFKAGDPRDLMDVYLQMLHSEDKKPSFSGIFSESQLLAICMDMFMAGSETTSKSLGFAFLYLLLNPEVQKRARDEVDTVVGRDRLPNLNDRPKMPYIEALVLESVRLFMGRTFSIPHRTLKATTLQGYHIPKDTMVIANFNGVLMDKNFWKDPEVFRPDRFLDKDGKVFIPDQYMPFGFGKHRCMGQTLARTNIFLFTSCLLHTFEFSIPEGTDPPGTEGIDGLTPSPGIFHALVKLRT